MGDGFETRDSGERAEFGNNFVRDINAGKARFDLITPAGIPFEDQYLTRIAELMARGALKYNERNWENARGEEAARRFGESAFRHFMQWYLGVEDGEDHAAAVFFNIQGYEFVKWHNNNDLTPTSPFTWTKPVEDHQNEWVAYGGGGRGGNSGDSSGYTAGGNGL